MPIIVVSEGGLESDGAPLLTCDDVKNPFIERKSMIPSVPRRTSRFHPLGLEAQHDHGFSPGRRDPESRDPRGPRRAYANRRHVSVWQALDIRHSVRIKLRSHRPAARGSFILVVQWPFHEAKLVAEGVPHDGPLQIGSLARVEVGRLHGDSTDGLGLTDCK